MLVLWQHFLLIVLREVSELRLSNEFFGLSLDAAQVVQEVECFLEAANSEVRQPQLHEHSVVEDLKRIRLKNSD